MKKYVVHLFICSCFFMLNSIAAQILNPGDGVRLTFYNITDQISGDYFIQKNNTLQLPFIGILNADKREFESLRNEILSKYDSLYRQPEITVRPLFRINILGEVKTPGSYYVTGVERLSDLIAQAGGETSDANLDDVYIERQDKQIKVDASQIIQQGNKVNDISLVSGDRVYIPRKWWVGARNIAMIVSGAAVLITLAALFIQK